MPGRCLWVDLHGDDRVELYVIGARSLFRVARDAAGAWQVATHPLGSEPAAILGGDLEGDATREPIVAVGEWPWRVLDPTLVHVPPGSRELAVETLVPGPVAFVPKARRDGLLTLSITAKVTRHLRRRPEVAVAPLRAAARRRRARRPAHRPDDPARPPHRALRLHDRRRDRRHAARDHPERAVDQLLLAPATRSVIPPSVRALGRELYRGP